MHHFSNDVSAKCMSLYKTAFSALDQHVLSSSLWALPLLTRFEQSAWVCTKQSFSAQHQHVLSFSHLAHYFLAIFSKVLEFVQNSVFRRRSACFVIFALGALLFSDFQQSARVCRKQRFQPKISTFCHFHIGHTPFYTFKQRAPVWTTQCFQSEIRTFCHFPTWLTTF